MLGDLTAFAASFLILGEVIAAGALGIAPFYVDSRPSWIRELINHLTSEQEIEEWFALITPAPDRDLNVQGDRARRNCVWLSTIFSSKTRCSPVC
jgi:hypothetical protein